MPDKGLITMLAQSRGVVIHKEFPGFHTSAVGENEVSGALERCWTDLGWERNERIE